VLIKLTLKECFYSHQHRNRLLSCFRDDTRDIWFRFDVVRLHVFPGNFSNETASLRGILSGNV
jgi:hypothetical protein